MIRILQWVLKDIKLLCLEWKKVETIEKELKLCKLEEFQELKLMSHKWHLFILWQIITINQLLVPMKNKNNILVNNRILHKFKKWWSHLNHLNIFPKINKVQEDLEVQLELGKSKVRIPDKTWSKIIIIRRIYKKQT